MTRLLHLIVGGMTASVVFPYLTSGHPVYLTAGLILIGSIFPDFDLRFTQDRPYRERTLVNAHRGWTHHVIFGLILLLAAVLSQSSPLEGFAVGVCSHIFADAFSPMGVPYWKYHNRIRIPLYRTNGFSEYIFAVFLVAILLIIKHPAWIGKI